MDQWGIFYPLPEGSLLSAFRNLSKSYVSLTDAQIACCCKTDCLRRYAMIKREFKSNAFEAIQPLPIALLEVGVSIRQWASIDDMCLLVPPIMRPIKITHHPEKGLSEVIARAESAASKSLYAVVLPVNVW